MDTDGLIREIEAWLKRQRLPRPGPWKAKVDRARELFRQGIQRRE